MDLPFCPPRGHPRSTSTASSSGLPAAFHAVSAAFVGNRRVDLSALPYDVEETAKSMAASSRHCTPAVWFRPVINHTSRSARYSVDGHLTTVFDRLYEEGQVDLQQRVLKASPHSFRVDAAAWKGIREEARDPTVATRTPPQCKNSMLTARCSAGWTAAQKKCPWRRRESELRAAENAAEKERRGRSYSAERLRSIMAPTTSSTAHHKGISPQRSSSSKPVSH